MGSSLLLQQCLGCLVRLTWIVFVMGGKCNFEGCCIPGLVQYCSQDSCVVAVKFFSIRFVCVHVVHPYISIDTTAAWKKLCFILSVRSNLHMTDSLSLAVHAFASRVLMSVSVDKTLLHWLVNFSTS